ncbi:arginine--tRNA ligase [Pseudobacteriovorax antillogorgiicola]|uniref:Arginine--tRNA ligase n=1 Tax=Pseudobacteriovorax antillogorgiicola TaxID=1513793 RepID=A0A1Y6CCL8_9BACT|nr:arginine--tRNA ligase [Pseudobacteriovorax antillogorgiicola]TCS48700.1 arginyl-tRNA synthetase [Pseudobacteriovorax antillogorgiicola]SMF54723.1 arginyl-tRNA synthetase [Pseudobacteriovorax antillogorgiicola]
MAQALDHSKWQIALQIEAIINQMIPEGGDRVRTEDVYNTIERPKEPKMGDYACPCFRFAKAVRKKPPELASAICEGLLADGGAWIEHAETVGPFLNLKVKLATLSKYLFSEVQSGEYFKKIAVQSEKPKVMIEYSQPNTHKVFHVGHMRNVALGDGLGRLYEYCGYPVVMANYIGDEGAHIAKCLWYIQKHNLKTPEQGQGEWLGEIYSKACILLEDASAEEKAKYQEEVSEVLRAIESKKGETFDFWQTSRQWSIDDFKDIYSWVGARFDHWFSESEVSEESQKIVEEFLDKGVFVEDDGAIGIDLKDDKLGFVILRKRDGNTLYATKDLALARRKYSEFEIIKSIYVVASEQNLHFKQVFKTLEKMGFEQAKDCYHLSYGMVVLPDGKMSSRKGNVITFKELKQALTVEMEKKLEKYQGEWTAEEIADTNHKLCVGAIRYGMICSDPVKDIVFNIQDWTSFEGNTGPYLMYAYARTKSIMTKAQDQGLEANPEFHHLLKEDDERELLRFLNDFNNAVLQSCEGNRLSSLAHFLFDMCKTYNRMLSNVSILKADSDDLKRARLALLDTFATTLKTGLEILGINTPERM